MLVFMRDIKWQNTVLIIIINLFCQVLNKIHGVGSYIVAVVKEEMVPSHIQHAAYSEIL